MKFALVTITEHFCEYEFDSRFLVKAASEAKLEKAVEKIVKDYRGGGEVISEVDSVKLIPQTDYDVLKKYLSEL